MNKKGMIGMATVLGGFIAIIVALILIQGSFPFVGTATNTIALTNGSFTMPATGSKIDLVGQELTNTPVVINQTGFEVVPASNYTIAETISTVDGLKRISLTSNGGLYSSRTINVSYVYGPEGYVDSAGGRGVTTLIPIMAALAIVITAVAIAMRERFY